MPGLFGSDDKTQESTQTTEYPAWMGVAQQAATNAGTAMASPFLKTPKYQIAGFNPDQTKSFDLARQMAQGAFTGGQGRGVPALAATMGPAALTTPAMASAAQVDGADIEAQMNPFLRGVLGTTLGTMRDEYAKTDADIGAKYAAAGAFGGSREAVRRAANDEAFGERVASTSADLMAKGWDQATATALANAQMEQQTSLTNAGAQNTAGQFNATSRNNREQWNAGALNGYALSAAGLDSSLMDAEQARRTSALATLLGIGDKQQGLAQQAIDLPWTNLQRLMAVTPQAYGSTTTSVQPDNSPGAFQQLLGLGTSILGMGTGGGGTIAGSLLGKVL